LPISVYNINRSLAFAIADIRTVSAAVTSSPMGMV